MDKLANSEVTDTPVENQSDDVQSEASSTVATEKPEDLQGPWDEDDAGKRQKKSLDMGFMTDYYITIGYVHIRCHKHTVGSSSPELYRKIVENPVFLTLPNVEEKYFRILLGMIYGEESKELNNLDILLGVGKVANELKVFSALRRCTQKLSELLNPSSVCEIVDFACIIPDGGLKQSCIEVIRKETKAVLNSDAFNNCSVATLEMILSQEVVQDVTEVDLFLACNRWAQKRENPREALGPALNHIRFRVFTSQEFTDNVETTNLLSDAEQKSFFSYFLNQGGKRPEGFSNEKNKRHLYPSNEQIRTVQQTMSTEKMQIKKTGAGIYQTPKELVEMKPLIFYVNEDVWLMGAGSTAAREHEITGEKYTENVTVTLNVGKQWTGIEMTRNERMVASATFEQEVERDQSFEIMFQPPVLIQADVQYALHYMSNVTGTRTCSGRYGKQTCKTESLEMNVEYKGMTVIDHLIFNIPNVQ